MGNTTNSDRFAKSVKQIHAGLNHQTMTASFTATASGTETINLMPIVRGMKFVDITVTTDSNHGGTGAESVIIKSETTGKTYLSATFAACAVGARMGNTTSLHAALDYVHTASDTLVLQTTSTVGTGTASISFKIGLTYTVEEDPQ